MALVLEAYLFHSKDLRLSNSAMSDSAHVVILFHLFHSTGTSAGTLEQTRNRISIDPEVHRRRPYKVLDRPQ